LATYWQRDREIQANCAYLAMDWLPRLLGASGGKETDWVAYIEVNVSATRDSVAPQT
jgi:hypothetical protein